jgi:hypothetical protein
MSLTIENSVRILEDMSCSVEIAHIVIIQVHDGSMLVHVFVSYCSRLMPSCWGAGVGMFGGATSLEQLFQGSNAHGVAKAHIKPKESKAKSDAFIRPCTKAGGVAACKRKSGGVTPQQQSNKRQKLVHATCSQTTTKIGMSCKKAMAASKRKLVGVTTGPPRRKQKVEHASGSQTSVEEASVGLVGETEAEHRLRHVQPVASCAHCQWLAWGKSWREKQGCHIAHANGQAERIEWVSERATCRGGFWALGCSVCSHAVQRLSGESGMRARRTHGRLQSKWARFEIRSSYMQASTLSNHANGDGHKMALEMFLSADIPVRELLADPLSLEDHDLLKGSVPQPSDWLRAWRHLKEGVSFRSSARLAGTESYIQSGYSHKLDRKSAKALQEIVVEEKREQKRNWLRHASSIAISLDDRRAWKILRFRCDHMKGFQTGVLGVLHRGGDGVSEVEAWDEDFCRREAESVMKAIRMFCISLLSGFDEGLFEHIRSCTHVYASDGCAAALKTGRMLKTSHLTKIAFMIRDPAHAIRIAGRDPLHAEERFGAFWTRVFDSKHALCRDIQCSDQMRAKLESCQERVVQVMGSQGGGLQSILKHLSAAKQRFESFASPARRYCLLLTSMALFLALIANDHRKDKETRQRAAEFLESMTPDSIVVAGLTADYTAECLDFVRHFDRSNVDPATIASVRDAFKERMSALFLQGFAALEPPEDTSKERTMLQIAMAQVADMPVFHYNEKRHVLWSAGAAAQVKTTVARMASVVQALNERLDAELNDADMVCKLQAFHLEEWIKSELPTTKSKALYSHVRAIARSLGLDPIVAQTEFKDLLPAAIATREQLLAKSAEGIVIDNREVWGELLDSPLIVSCTVLPSLIRLYEAVPLGTPDVERNLGKLTELLSEHTGGSGETLWMVLEGALETAALEEELFVRNHGSSQFSLRMTEMSRAWQRMWIALHGRRFGGYTKSRSRAPTKKEKPTSEAQIQQGRRAAATRLVIQARVPNADLEAKCFGGLVRRDVSGSALAHVVKNLHKSHKQVLFQQRTKQIKEGRDKETVLRRRLGTTWCTQPNCRANSSSVSEPPALPDRVQVVLMRTSAGFHIASTAVVSVRPSLYSAVKVAHVIVVTDMKAIDKCDTWDSAILLVYAVGLGKIMIGEIDWQGARPWLGPKAIRYQPQAMSTSVVLVASSRLQKHSNVMTALRACTEGSKWSLVTERPVNPGAALVQHLDELPDLRRFLQTQRRIFIRRGATGKFQKF